MSSATFIGPGERILAYVTGMVDPGAAVRIEYLVAENRILKARLMGCPVGENVGGVDYHQYLGLFDALGQLNAWGSL